MFGGNSNWRGPIWIPVNMLILRALIQYHLYYGDTGVGIGASHQTGWTGAIARIIHLFASTDGDDILERGKEAVLDGRKKPTSQARIMNILTIDIGGTNIKILATGQSEPRKFPSGRDMTPAMMVEGVKEIAGDWEYDVVSIGYPGPVIKGKIAKEPHNLGQGWMGFDFEAAFERPVRILNDAAMQALGSYESGTMFFLGFGTGLGSALVVDGVVVPMELAHLPYKKGSYEDYLGDRGRKRLGKGKWRKHVTHCVERLASALQLDDVVLGGGNAKRIKKLPKGSRLGSNANAFIGGYRMWESAEPNPASVAKQASPST